MATTTKKAAAKKAAPEKKETAPKSVAEVPDEPMFEPPTGEDKSVLPEDPHYVDGPGSWGEQVDDTDRDLFTLRTPQSKNPDDRPYKQ